MSPSRRLATALAVLAVSSVGAVPAASAATAPSDTTVQASRTLFGVSLPYQSGKTIAQSVASYRDQFGGLPVVRVFDSTPPAVWKKNATLAALGNDSSVIYSFQGDMDAIAAGTMDAQLTSFLTSRPAGVKVWVALHHEPEDDIKAGAFTAAQFRAATAHVAPVIRAAGGIPTTVLMAWTLDQQSGRDWHDYYSPAVDVMAYDAYNSGQAKAVPTYKTPDKFLDPVLAVAKETGKPFGWAELGSPCISTDPTCVGRSAWLTSLGTAFAARGAQFVTYWNRASATADLDFALNDTASIEAWRGAVRTALNQPPVASAGVSCIDLRCTVDGSASSDPDGSVASYTWTWGDGSTSTGATATHDYATAGSYRVGLTVTDDDGATGRTTQPATATAHVNVAPTASFTASCQLRQCTFDGTGSSDADGAVQSWSWSFGDSTHGVDSSAGHTFPGAGTYPVSLTVADDAGASHTTSQQLTVEARPIAFRASSSLTSSSATLLQVPVPAGVQVGDALLLKVSTSGVGSNPTPAAGWSEVTRQVAGTALTVVWQRMATEQDALGARVAVQLTNPIKSTSQILAYSGTAETSPASVVVSTADDTLTTSHTAPSVQIPTDDSWLLTFWTDKSSTSTSWNPPSDLNVRASTFGTGNGYLNTVLADEGGPRPAGLVPARTATTDAGTRAAMTTIVLAPATR